MPSVEEDGYREQLLPSPRKQPENEVDSPLHLLFSSLKKTYGRYSKRPISLTQCALSQNQAFKKYLN